VLLAAVLVNALHSPLENRIIALNRVRVDVHSRLAVKIAVFLAGVIDRAVLGELPPELGVTLI
jgi:hypothetical protein